MISFDSLRYLEVPCEIGGDWAWLVCKKNRISFEHVGQTHLENFGFPFVLFENMRVHNIEESLLKGFFSVATRRLMKVDNTGSTSP